MAHVPRGLRALAGLARSVDRTGGGSGLASSGLSCLVPGAAGAAPPASNVGVSGAARSLANPRWKSSIAHDGTATDDSTAPRAREADVEAVRDLIMSMARKNLKRDVTRLTRTSVNALRVGELREVLASLGEGTEGTKVTLTERLVTAMGDTMSPPRRGATPPPPTPAGLPGLKAAAAVLEAAEDKTGLQQRRARKAVGREALNFLLEKFEAAGIKGNKRNPKDLVTPNMVEKIKVKELRAGLEALGVQPEGLKKDVVLQWLGLIYFEEPPTPAAAEMELPPVPVFQRPPPPPPPPTAVPLSEVVELLVRCRTRNVVVVDVSQKCDFTDKLVIASAGSRSLAQSAAHAVGGLVREGGAGGGGRGHKPGIEGEGTDWMCVNGGRFLVHVMTDEARGYYDLEGLWGGEGGKDILRPVPEPKRQHSFSMG